MIDLILQFTEKVQLLEILVAATGRLSPIPTGTGYTANVLTIKTTGTGNCGVPAGKICTIYGKGL